MKNEKILLKLINKCERITNENNNIKRLTHHLFFDSTTKIIYKYVKIKKIDIIIGLPIGYKNGEIYLNEKNVNVIASTWLLSGYLLYLNDYYFNLLLKIGYEKTVFYLGERRIIENHIEKYY
jgi:hypothetical protein